MSLVFAGQKVGTVYIPSVCLCTRGYQRRIRARCVGNLIYVVEKVLYRLGPPKNVGFTRKDHRITPDHLARTRALVRVHGSITWVRGLVHTHSHFTVCFVVSKNMFESMFNMSMCACGILFAYLSAHVRVMIICAFHQISQVHLGYRLLSMRVRGNHVGFFVSSQECFAYFNLYFSAKGHHVRPIAARFIARQHRAHRRQKLPQGAN